MKAPKWLREKFTSARRLVGVGDDWQLFIQVSDDLARDGVFDGTCNANPISLCATIRCAENLKRNDADEIVIHEMLHVLHSEVDAFVEATLKDHNDSEMLLTMYSGCYERFMHRLSRSLTNNVKEILDRG